MIQIEIQKYHRKRIIYSLFLMLRLLKKIHAGQTLWILHLTCEKEEEKDTENKKTVEKNQTVA